MAIAAGAARRRRRQRIIPDKQNSCRPASRMQLLLEQLRDSEMKAASSPAPGPRVERRLSLNRLVPFVAGLALTSSMLATPTMATTDSGAYGKHLVDCLGMLFGDPKVHQADCGPFNQPQFWFPTGGSGPACPQVGELSPSSLPYLPGLGVSDENIRVSTTTSYCPPQTTSLPPDYLDFLHGLEVGGRVLVAINCI
jgi:hypothetical protein